MISLNDHPCIAHGTVAVYETQPRKLGGKKLVCLLLIMRGSARGAQARNVGGKIVDAGHVLPK